MTRPLDEYAEAEVQRLLAEDVGVAEQGITVERRENTLVLCGEVESVARRDEIAASGVRALPRRAGRRDIGVTRAGAPTEVEELRVIRIAAVGDVHLDEDVVGRFRPALERLPEQADVLLLAGDLTRHGTEEEARCVATEFGGLAVPVVAVLGNHDYHCDQVPQVVARARGRRHRRAGGRRHGARLRRHPAGHRRRQGLRRRLRRPLRQRVRRAGDEGVRPTHRHDRRDSWGPPCATSTATYGSR